MFCLAIKSAKLGLDVAEEEDDDDENGGFILKSLQKFTKFESEIKS